MSSQPPTVTCSNPDCRVAETGKCVEGLEVGKCPHFGKSPDAEAEGQVEIDRGLTLRPAERLSAADARVLLREADSRVIAIVGPTGAGKTSLIASLYDLFQDGPVSELMCGRSATLHAFEQACHDARAASLRDTPHSERTPRGDVAFYHLDVVGPGMERRLTLLIGDRAGEEYRSVADDPQAARSLHEVA